MPLLVHYGNEAATLVYWRGLYRLYITAIAFFQSFSSILRKWEANNRFGGQTNDRLQIEYLATQALNTYPTQRNERHSKHAARQKNRRKYQQTFWIYESVLD